MSWLAHTRKGAAVVRLVDLVSWLAHTRKGAAVVRLVAHTRKGAAGWTGRNRLDLSVDVVVDCCCRTRLFGMVSMYDCRLVVVVVVSSKIMSEYVCVRTVVVKRLNAPLFSM